MLVWGTFAKIYATLIPTNSSNTCDEYNECHMQLQMLSMLDCTRLHTLATALDVAALASSNRFDSLRLTSSKIKDTRKVKMIDKIITLNALFISDRVAVVNAIILIPSALPRHTKMNFYMTQLVTKRTICVTMNYELITM